MAPCFQPYTGSHGAKPHHGTLVVGDIDGMDPAMKEFGFLCTPWNNSPVPGDGPFNRADFTGYNKFAFIKICTELHLIPLLAEFYREHSG
jgi:hypothetical protein